MKADNADKGTKTTERGPAVPPTPMVVEESRTVPDGPHVGVVDHTEYAERGDAGYRYFDVHLRPDDADDVVIKVGYAAGKVTPETDLGKLLRRMGAQLIVGQPVNWDVVKPGTRVRFDTEQEQTKNGRFARVLPESLRRA